MDDDTDNSEDDIDPFDEPPTDWDPGDEVTPELFAEWASPREGRSNPERLDNPVWASLIRTPVTAWTARETAREKFPGTSARPPGWCFHRFGQSSTALPDGRVVLIAGEHEDHYDPDFHIYNDVVVRHPDGRLEIFGYPRDEFPPTDFHSATLAGDRIVLVGSLGYDRDRKPGTTQVAILDLHSFRIELVTTTGPCPGWIHKHLATLSDDGRSIVVTGGLVDPGDGPSLVENFDDWRLDLDNRQWERLTRRRWSQWSVGRVDEKPVNLSQARMAADKDKYFVSSDDTAGKTTTIDASTLEALVDPEIAEMLREFQSEQEKWARESNTFRDERLAAFREFTGPDADYRVVKSLFVPPIPFDPLSETGDSYDVHRIRIDGVTVRYTEELLEVRITVEGELPAATVNTLVADLRTKLERLEGVPCRATQIRPGPE